VDAQLKAYPFEWLFSISRFGKPISASSLKVKPNYFKPSESDFNAQDESQEMLFRTVFFKHFEPGGFRVGFRPGLIDLDSSMTILWPPDKALKLDWASSWTVKGHQINCTKTHMTPAKTAHPCGTIY
jgi:hypothetical protein